MALRRIGWQAKVVLAALLWCALALQSVPASARLGRILFWDSTDCYNVSPYFKQNGRGTLSLLRNGARIQGPITLGRSNEYGEVPGRPGLRLPSDLSGSFALKLTCGNTTYTRAITPTDIPLRDFTFFQNNSPKFFNAEILALDGATYVPVRQVSPGSTVKIKFRLTDVDSSGLSPSPDPSFQIKSLYGVLTKTKETHPNAAAWDYEYSWKLPTAPGLYDVYLSTNDARGGFTEQALKIDAEAGGLLPSNPFKFDSGPSNALKQSDQFLTFYSTNAASYIAAGGDSARSSCAYYMDLGFASACNGDGMTAALTFSQWRRGWGFSEVLTPGSTQVHAVYANLADLRLERAMNAIYGANGAAFYVCNYPFEDAQLGNGSSDISLSRARNNTSLGACVAMEYAKTRGKNGGRPFTRFLVFDPKGALVRSANLDGRGMKFVPGVCVVCHGAQAGYSRYAETPGTGNPAMGAAFLPFDLDNYHFSSLAGYTRSSQESVLRKLNFYVRDHTSPPQPIRELINGWYPTPTSTFHGSFVPSGWSTAPAIYRQVVKPACRTCHVATRFPFNTKAGFDAAAGLMNTVVCGNYGSDDKLRYAMPNARETFDRFWQSIGGQAGVNQPAALRNYLRTALNQPTLACDPPQ